MDTFEYKGRMFSVEIESDDDYGAPWEECDGHGPVSDWTTRAKRAGEMVLCSDNRGSFRRYYDVQEACKIAKRDGWGFMPGKVIIKTNDEGKLPFEKRGGTATCGEFFASDDEDANKAIRSIYAQYRATVTPNQYAFRAVMQDYGRLKAWCNDHWNYVGVVVTLLDSDDEETNETESIWGIESDDYNYHKEVAEDLAAQILGPVTDQEAEEIAMSRPDMAPAYEGVGA